MTTRDLGTIAAELSKNGYQQKHQTKKSAEFRDKTGVVVYLRSESTINKIVLNVDPRIDWHLLSIRLSNLVDLDPEYKHHSNLTRFPKRLHRGEKPISYCWQIKINTLNGVAPVLRELSGIGFLS